MGRTRENDLGEDRYEYAPEGEREAGPEVPAAEKGPPTRHSPARIVQKGKSAAGTETARLCPVEVVISTSSPFRRSVTWAGVSGLAGWRVAWKAVCVVQGDGGRSGRGCAAGESGGVEEKERWFHGTSVEVGSALGEPEN